MAATRSISVGRLIAQALADAGVGFAFTVPGESFLPLLEALPQAGIRVVATRHEGGAAFMAEAVGSLTGRPAACLGTRAVGAANLAIGIHTARQNSTPMVAIVGQVERELRGREAFQEVEQAESFGRLAKWAAELDEPAAMAEMLGAALRTMATGRPGPVYLSVPEDVFGEWLPETTTVDVAGTPPAQPDGTAVQAVVDLLARAERPAIIAGGGVRLSGARDLLVELSEQLEVPVFAAWRRPDVFPNDHPHYLGMTGYGSPATVRERLAAADALLVIGCRLNEIASFGYAIPAPTTRWAHVDLAPRAEAIGGLPPADLPLAADATAFLRAAVEVAAALPAVERARREELADDRDVYVAARGPDTDDRGTRGVHPGRVVETLQRMLPPEAILTTDAGNFGLWPARSFRFTRPATFLGPTSGAMGYGLPAAIAASLCRPDVPVVAMCGDGGFAMTMSELETAVRERARIIALVFDNRRYGTIAMHQRRGGHDQVATELGPIDFSAVARACGAQGGRVTRDAELEPALRDALAAERPAVIQLEVDPAWVSPGVVAEASQPQGGRVSRSPG